ncbi:MAG: hypothetical protein EZS28_047761, partial [Streblomastix strix]
GQLQMSAGKLPYNKDRQRQRCKIRKKSSYRQKGLREISKIVEIQEILNKEL